MAQIDQFDIDTMKSVDDPLKSNKDIEDEDDDSVSVAAFTAVDFSGVNFDVSPSSSPADVHNANVATNDDNDDVGGNQADIALAAWERQTPFRGFLCSEEEEGTSLISNSVSTLGEMLAAGKYAQILRDSDVAVALFEGAYHTPVDSNGCDAPLNVRRFIRQRVLAIGSASVTARVELELLGIAALNLFLQSNYTGPCLDDSALTGINPHPCFMAALQLTPAGVVDEETRHNSDISKEMTTTESSNNGKYQNAVLAELAVDGEWPCQVCHHPYFLLLARSILLTLVDPKHSGWTLPFGNDDSATIVGAVEPPLLLGAAIPSLHGVKMWSVRAVVAHERLLQSRRPTETLWIEAERMFNACRQSYCSQASVDVCDSADVAGAATIVMLEWGLAQHHFDRPGTGKNAFTRALKLSGLDMQVTGAIGKRTKYQQQATAQMVVRAKSASAPVNNTAGSERDKDSIVKEKIMVEHSEGGILLEKIKFEDEKDNAVHELNVLDQSILLALCLDVKNSNPADGLTGEEMGAYLARVLDHCDDWMVYSTALLERAWLEFERSHARERAILQMQALSDQHTNRLTITQSTRESIENSAPVQERLRNLHTIVYPPRWAMIQDLADRYASLGIVTSAAELYTEIELWDSVVECYRRAGRVSHAENIVRERLVVNETPRMWAALGDLTKDPEHYEKAIELSKGRYSDAYLALGEHYFGKGDLEVAADYYEKALKVRPLIPAAWFRLGNISMQLSRWQNALRAFSEVVLQQPEEAEAWANIAAVHMHNKQPAEAYPALNESLKHMRSNWRVWVSKLYTCLDLKKYDEAIQACGTLLDLRVQKQASEGIPPLEEKCIRAIVGGSLQIFYDSRGDDVALDSSRRTLSRVHTLLDRISSSADSTAESSWVFETMTYFHEKTGQDSDKVLDTLTKEYRALQTNTSWEKDNHLVRKVCQVVSHMVHIYKNESGREGLTKARFVLRGVIQRIRTTRPDDDSVPDEVRRLETLLSEMDDMRAQPST